MPRTLMVACALFALMTCQGSPPPAPPPPPPPEATDTTLAQEPGPPDTTPPVPAEAPVAAIEDPPSPPTPSAPATPAVLEMQVSERLFNHLVPITERTYAEKALPTLFKKLRETGDTYCAMAHELAPDDLELASTYIHKRRVSDYLAECGECAENIMMGCWNFYEMNDRTPDRDMRLVGHLRPEPRGYECYGTGMIQPYMMHAILGCDSLTFLDWSWRIQDAHWQLLRLLRNQDLTDDTLERKMRKLQLGWSAARGKFRNQPTQDGRLAFFCNGSEKRPLCAETLLTFQDRFDRLSALRLELAALHDGNILTSDRTKVFFFSNALEREYTSPRQFAQLKDNIEAAVLPGGRAILIHHVGGWPEFGLYEITRDTAGTLSLTTLCRDDYKTTGKRKDPTYDIALDTLSSTPPGTAPTCASLVEAM